MGFSLLKPGQSLISRKELANLSDTWPEPTFTPEETDAQSRCDPLSQSVQAINRMPRLAYHKGNLFVRVGRLEVQSQGGGRFSIR